MIWNLQQVEQQRFTRFRHRKTFSSEVRRIALSTMGVYSQKILSNGNCSSWFCFQEDGQVLKMVLCTGQVRRHTQRVVSVEDHEMIAIMTNSTCMPRDSCHSPPIAAEKGNFYFGGFTVSLVLLPPPSPPRSAVRRAIALFCHSSLLA